MTVYVVYAGTGPEDPIILGVFRDRAEAEQVAWWWGRLPAWGWSAVYDEPLLGVAPSYPPAPAPAA